MRERVGGPRGGGGGSRHTWDGGMDGEREE